MATGWLPASVHRKCGTPCLNQHDAKLEKVDTKTYLDGGSTMTYPARNWSYQCLPTGKG